jgi:hypothetical protein
MMDSVTHVIDKTTPLLGGAQSTGAAVAPLGTTAPLSAALGGEKHTPIDDSEVAPLTLRDHIIKTYLRPALERDIETLIRSSYVLRHTGDAFEWIGKVFIGLSVLTAFAQSAFSMPQLSYVSGSCSTLALVSMQLSSYSQSESRERTEQLNKRLAENNIPPIVDIVIDSTKQE